VTFTGLVDAEVANTETISVTAGAGAVTFNQNVGATNPMGSFTIVSSAQTDLANVIADGAIAVTGTNIDLNSTTYTSNSDAITFTGAVDLDLSAGTTTVTSGGGDTDDIEFTSTIDDDGAGDTDLTLDAGALGDVTVTGDIGAGTAIDDLTVDGLAISLNDIGAAGADGAGIVDVEGVATGSVTFTGTAYRTDGDQTYDAGGVARPITLNESAVFITSDDNVTFTGLVDAEVANTETISVTAGAGAVTFNQNVGATNAIGSFTITSATQVDLDDVTAAGSLTLDSVTTVADGATLSAGTNLSVGTASLTGGGALTLIATVGAISGSGTIQADAGVGTQDLTLRQGSNLNLATLTIGNQSSTNLTAQSYSGGVTIDKTIPANAADQWQSIATTAQGNVTLIGDGDITANTMASTGGNIGIESTTGDLIVNGSLAANAGGVSLISMAGKIYTTGGANDTLNVPITGYSDGAAGVGLLLGSGKAAIVLRSSDDLILGQNAALTANGLYNPATNDDRGSVDFDTSTTGGGDPMDVAIYLGSSRLDPPIGTVTVNSKVEIADNGSMVVDAGETVTFGGIFNESIFNQTQRLEVVSRSSNNLNEVIRFNRLPFAENPEAIRNWFNETSTGYFAGAYVLRGVRTLLAEVLALSNPVPLVPPRTLEPELRSEVEGPDTQALMDLLSELGIGVQPYMTEAYADSLSTDLRLYKAAEKLQKLMPILEDADGTRIAALKAAVEQFFPTLDLLSEDQMNSFTLVLESHKGDGTNYDLAGQCIFALRDYVNILSTEIGWPVETSVEFVMGRYVPRITENDEIRIAVIQMHLQQ